MRISRLYLAQPLAVGQTIELEGDAFHYAARVLRLRTGATLTVFNGQGGEFAARFAAVSRRAATLTLESFDPQDRSSQVSVTSAAGITRGDRMDVTIRRCTELGIARFQPLMTERGGVSLSDAERLQKRLEHWQQVAIAACEQCGHNRVPAILPPKDLSRWLEELSASADDALSIVFDPQATSAWSALPAEARNVVVLTGAEGGLTPEEVARATEAGFHAVRLGPRTLRAETAAVSAAALAQARFGDLLE